MVSWKHSTTLLSAACIHKATHLFIRRSHIIPCSVCTLVYIYFCTRGTRPFFSKQPNISVFSMKHSASKCVSGCMLLLLPPASCGRKKASKSVGVSGAWPWSITNVWNPIQLLSGMQCSRRLGRTGLAVAKKQQLQHKRTGGKGLLGQTNGCEAILIMYS